MDQARQNAALLDLQDEANRHALERALPAYLGTRRWFGDKARTIRDVRVVDAVSIGHARPQRSQVVIAEVTFEDGDAQRYVLPIKLDLASGDDDAQATANGEIARWQADDNRSTVVASDATLDPEFGGALLDAIAHGHRWSGQGGEIVAWSTPHLASIASPGIDLSPSVIGTEQSNTSIRYGEALILKLFRRLEEGTSPELEIGRALQAGQFDKTPPLGGAIEYARSGGEPLTLAVLQGFVPNRGDAWRYTLETLKGYYERTHDGATDRSMATVPTPDVLDLADHPVPAEFDAFASGYTKSAALLGRTTAQMHLALGSVADGPAFAPEALDIEHREQMYAAMRLLSEQAFGLLRANLDNIPADATDEAQSVLRHASEIDTGFAPLLEPAGGGELIRVHGDYHLGQVLYTGRDFYVIDFEGEPVRNLAERRRKHSPLKDVAGMVRSFHYAAYSGLFDHARTHGRSLAGNPDAERWADTWYSWTSAAFLRAYIDTIAGSNLLPNNTQGVRVLLSAYLLEKAVYELVYELNNRPTWVAIPLKGISALLS
jgi:trehalose synthase-fused probable maltokinase